MNLNQQSEVLKSPKKSTFFKGVSPWFLSKIRLFYHGYFLGKLIKKSLFF